MNNLKIGKIFKILLIILSSYTSGMYAGLIFVYTNNKFNAYSKFIFYNNCSKIFNNSIPLFILK